MKPNPSATDLSARLRNAIERRYPGRGRFTALERDSGVRADRWKNFFYGRQAATDELRCFWFATFPEDRDWIETGLVSSLATLLSSLPDNTASVRDRVVWLVNRIGGAPIRYKTVSATLGVSARKWQNVCNSAQQPTIEMLVAIGEYCPLLCEWLLIGRVPQSEGRVLSLVAPEPSRLSSLSALVAQMAGDVVNLQRELSRLEASGEC